MAEDNGAQTMANEAKKLVMDSMQESQAQTKSAIQHTVNTGLNLTKKSRKSLLKKIREKMLNRFRNPLSRLIKGKGLIGKAARRILSPRYTKRILYPPLWKGSPMNPIMQNNEQKKMLQIAMVKTLRDNPELMKKVMDEYMKMLQQMPGITNGQGKFNPLLMSQQQGKGQGFYKEATKAISQATENIKHSATKATIKSAAKSTEAAITAASTAAQAIPVPGVGAAAKAGAKTAKASVKAAEKTAEKAEDAKHQIAGKIQGGQGMDVSKVVNIADKIASVSGKDGGIDQFAMTAVNMTQDAVKSQNQNR